MSSSPYAYDGPVDNPWALVESLAARVALLESDIGKKKPKNSSKDSGRNLFMTPYWATDTIIPFLPEGSVIWESAAGEKLTLMADRLEQHGFEVIRSDLRAGQDRFTWYPDLPFTIEVTNIPFSLKKEWSEQAIKDGHPFALLMPSDYTETGWYKDLEAKYDDLTKISPRGRIDFITPTNAAVFEAAYELMSDEERAAAIQELHLEPSSAQMHTSWFVHGLGLGTRTIHVGMNKPKKRSKKKVIKPKTIQPEVFEPTSYPIIFMNGRRLDRESIPKWIMEDFHATTPLGGEIDAVEFERSAFRPITSIAEDPAERELTWEEVYGWLA